MSVEEKVGQLFMPVLYGPRADTPSEENQARYGVRTPAEVIAQVPPRRRDPLPLGGQHIERRARSSRSPTGCRSAAGDIPLLIGVDQENGQVSRLGSLVTELARGHGDRRHRQDPLAREAARVTGTELRALGINLDFAPVADVNVNPSNPVIGPRAYGSDPKKVAGWSAPRSTASTPRAWPRPPSTSPATATPTWTATPACR